MTWCKPSNTASVGGCKSIAKTFQGHEAHFLTLAGRILQLDFET
jgi:hypothetical protein